LEAGKSAYAIGKELQSDVEKKFETIISINTLRDRAWRTRKKMQQEKNDGNPSNPPTPSTSTEIQEKAVSPEIVTQEDNKENPEKAAKQVVRGEKGNFITPPLSPGRSPKYKKEPVPKKRPKKIQVYSDAMSFQKFPQENISADPLLSKSGAGPYLAEPFQKWWIECAGAGLHLRTARGRGGPIRGAGLRLWGEGPGDQGRPLMDKFINLWGQDNLGDQG
jgi:hypothetical protein